MLAEGGLDGWAEGYTDGVSDGSEDGDVPTTNDGKTSKKSMASIVGIVDKPRRRSDVMIISVVQSLINGGARRNCDCESG